ncbi:MAG: hypothetical protein QGI45_17190, partial [Myxococcota bacterium]|nr:hypothetical protein [Myxococcota bacterium]
MMKTQAQNTFTRIIFIALLPFAIFACGESFVVVDRDYAESIQSQGEQLGGLEGDVQGICCRMPCISPAAYLSDEETCSADDKAWSWWPEKGGSGEDSGSQVVTCPAVCDPELDSEKRKSNPPQQG